MKQRQEQEINLLEMLLVAVLKWRRIVCTAVVVAFIAAMFTAVNYVVQVINPETVEKLQKEYEGELGAWKAEGIKIDNSIKAVERSLEDQEEYNESSWLMRMDPNSQWIGSLNIYIDNDYQILPGSSVQNENPVTRICAAYQDYVAPDAFYDAIISDNNLDFVKVKYLREIASVGVSSGNHTITVSVTADTEANCRKLLALLEAGINERYEFVNATIGEHTLNSSEVSVYSRANLDLERLQADNREKVESLNTDSIVLAAERREWEKKEKDIEVPVFSVADIVRKAIKYFLIGGVVAGLVMGMYYCLKYIMTQRVYGEEEFDENLRGLGELPERGKGPSKGLDLLFMKGFAVKVKRSEYDQRIKVVAMHAAKLAEESGSTGNNKIALVSDMSMAELESLAKDMVATNDKIYAAGNILSDYKAAVESTEASSVIIVVKCRESRRENIYQMIEQLRDRKANVLGVLFTNIIAQ